MPDWAVHSIIPLFALLIVTRQENIRYVIYLLPLAVISDLDHVFFMHRALLHNLFIPLIFLGAAMIHQSPHLRFMLITGAVYTASHMILDMFGGGVGLLYPFTSTMFFIDAGLSYQQGFSWMLDWGTAPYSENWMSANGYVFDSVGTGCVVFLLLAGACIYYRKKRYQNVSEVSDEQ